MRLFVAHFTNCIEDIWFVAGTSTVKSKKESFFLAAQLFAAVDPEAAYEKAIGMVEGMSDANNDGPGDRQNIFCLGIYDLEEIYQTSNSLSEAILEPYGLDVGHISWPERAPIVRSKNDLSLFAGYGT